VENPNGDVANGPTLTFRNVRSSGALEDKADISQRLPITIYEYTPWLDTGGIKIFGKTKRYDRCLGFFCYPA
jgi:hypothetical protein